MTPQTKGLDNFANDLNPAIVGQIRSWQGDKELDELFHRLQHRKTRRGFLDSFAEAQVALHARLMGCKITVEVPTPSGKMCDLLLERDGVKLYVHVKRLGGRSPSNKRLMISSRLRVLENIQKPWVVKIRWRAELDENALDALARTEPERLKAEILADKIKEANKYDDLDPQDKMDVESSFWERTKQGRVGDAFSGLFSSDDSGRDKSLEQEAKDNAELGGKIGAAAKLYSLLQPETQQAAPTIPTARITRGSIAFPGMKLASQKERRKYFTPKGLMA